MTLAPESRGFKIAQRACWAFQAGFMICAIAFIWGMACVGQIGSRSADSRSPEHPIRVVLARSDGTVYYLSRADYFWCQQLGIYATYGLGLTGIPGAALKSYLYRCRRG
jgi:hypothetical protein